MSLEGIANREIREYVAGRMFIYMPEDLSDNITFARDCVKRTQGKLKPTMATRYGRLLAAYPTPIVAEAKKTRSADHIKAIRGIGSGEMYWVCRETLEEEYRVRLKKEVKGHRHKHTTITDQHPIARAATPYIGGMTFSRGAKPRLF